MDSKANLYNKKRMNELAAQHNRLTTLCAGLLNEVIGLKKRVEAMENSSHQSVSLGDLVDDNRNRKVSSVSSSTTQSRYNPNNFNELKADDILRQLSVNTSSVPDN
jgi:hypothetical protein